jgi:SAM-dependent methyltransferase
MSRGALLDFWGIAPGSSVLEIGCGQGDTTSALAARVGAGGFVHALDCAGADYGAPETLGQARERLLAEYGGRLRMDFDADVLAPEFSPRAGGYDCAVLSLCSWYLKDFDELVKILARVRPWARTLCFAEWDLRLTDQRQLCHYLAVHVQAVCNAYAPNARSNVRSLFRYGELSDAMKSAGWAVSAETQIYAPELEDAVWERGNALAVCPAQIAEMDAPEGLKRLLRAELDELRGYRAEEVAPLNMVAIRGI